MSEGSTFWISHRCAPVAELSDKFWGKSAICPHLWDTQIVLHRFCQLLYTLNVSRRWEKPSADCLKCSDCTADQSQWSLLMKLMRFRLAVPFNQNQQNAFLLWVITQWCKTSISCWKGQKRSATVVLDHLLKWMENWGILHDPDSKDWTLFHLVRSSSRMLRRRKTLEASSTQQWTTDSFLRSFTVLYICVGGYASSGNGSSSFQRWWGENHANAKERVD